MFTGEEIPLTAEQRLVDTKNLLVAGRILEGVKVQVVKIQLAGIARLWWLIEEEYQLRPILWEAFSKTFQSKYFPETTKAKMEQTFINLR